MYYENCIDTIKGNGAKFDLLCELTNDPYENPEITKRLDESGIADFMDADPHWLPGLFAVFCDQKEQVMELVKKTNKGLSLMALM